MQAEVFWDRGERGQGDQELGEGVSKSRSPLGLGFIDFWSVSVTGRSEVGKTFVIAREVCW